MTIGSGNTSSDGEIVFIEPTTKFEIRDLRPGDANAVTALCQDDAQAELAAARDDDDADLRVGLIEREIVAVTATQRDGMANTLTVIAVHPEQRRRGVGRAMLQDALGRSGKRPLTAETPEAFLEFFKACGFKLVGRRKQPDGSFRYRVGWHTPGLRFKGGSSNALAHQELHDTNPEETS